MKRNIKIILSISFILSLCFNFIVIKQQQNSIEDLNNQLSILKNTIKENKSKSENEINKLKKTINKITK